MNTPDVDRQRVYHRTGRPIQLTNAPCAISLDRHKSGDYISMSVRDIVGYAYRVVTYCEAAAVGGWTDVDDTEDWILTVMSKLQVNGPVNGPVDGAVAHGGNSGLLAGETQ